MRFRNYLCLAIAFIILSSFSKNYGQIVFKELPNYKIRTTDSLFFDITQSRKIIPLDGEWQIYSSKDKEIKKVFVNVPSEFEGDGVLIFEKNFSLSKDEINNFKMKLFFLGLNYTADISINNQIIYRHSGGEFPFSLDLPRDILKEGSNNLLSVKLYYELDSENTIPVKQRFLFPRNFGGIFRDVYIHLIPNISIADANVTYDIDSRRDRITFKLNSKIENKEFRKFPDSLVSKEPYKIKITMYAPDGSPFHITPEEKFKLNRNKDKQSSLSLESNSPTYWSPQKPEAYTAKYELWQGEQLLDVTNKKVPVYSLNVDKNTLTLNKNPLKLNGVTYVPSFYDYGNLVSYNQMERDIKIIKGTGFNVVRFADFVPHPYYLELCERFGLLAFIEVPLNSIPMRLTQNQNFIARSKNYLKNFIKGFKQYSSVAAIGLGGSYLPDVSAHISFIQSLVNIAKENFNGLTYASFQRANLKEIPGLDFYGIELLNKLPTPIETEEINKDQQELGSGRIFISSATYIASAGNSDGYVNDHSYEAQAKFFQDVIDYSNKNNLGGYFINSMFDFRGDFTSIIGGYNNENLYKVGIIGEDRETNRLSYKVISSTLHNSENVTIPIGSKKDDSPMIFIVFGIVLAILIGILVNSGRKFREDASRALLRPYNFYADVRDQRIISGYHSTILLIVVSLVSGLLLSNLFYYFKDHVAFERVLLSFGSENLMKTVSYLSWNPFSSILWLSISTAVALIAFILIVQIGSFFVRNKVYLSSSFFTVVWSFLPLVLLIPVGIILYRILNAQVGNLYIFIILILFTIWIFYRLMKGIYVIFDVNPGSVYLYSILFILVIVSGIFIYYELNNSVFEYLQLTFNQYNLFG